MPKFMIERTVPGAGGLDAPALQALATKSNGVLRELGPDVQWVQSYVLDDKVVCVYNASNADLVHEHGRTAGFPVDQVLRVSTIIDPTTAEPGGAGVGR